jgi:undecaprenol kinase/diacylglycerol kinase (ATP)
VRKVARRSERAPGNEAVAPHHAVAGPGHGRHGLGKSFRFAAEGLAFALRTQRNLRIHFAAAGAVLLACAALPISAIEAVLLLAAVVIVLLAELFNTAIEAAVDLATSRFHPLAKTAKDVAAAAVLVASVFAVAVGAIVLADDLWPPRLRANGAAWAALAAPFSCALAWPLVRAAQRR